MDKKIVVPGSLDRIRHVEGELEHPDTESSPMAQFMQESLRLRRDAKKEIRADMNAIEGKVERDDPVQRYLEAMSRTKPTFVLEIKPELPPIEGEYVAASDGPQTIEEAVEVLVKGVWDEVGKSTYTSIADKAFEAATKEVKFSPPEVQHGLKGEFIEAPAHWNSEFFNNGKLDILALCSKGKRLADTRPIEGELVDKGVEVRVIRDEWPMHVSGPGIAAARHPSDREPIEWDFFVEPGMQFTRGKERQKPIRKLDDAWAAPYEVHKNFFDMWTAPKSDFFDRWGDPTSLSFYEIGAAPPISRGWYFMPLYWPDIKLLYSYLELEEALRYGHGRWMAGRTYNKADWQDRLAKWSNERREINTMFAWGRHVVHRLTTGKKDH